MPEFIRKYTISRIVLKLVLNCTVYAFSNKDINQTYLSNALREASLNGPLESSMIEVSQPGQLQWP